MNYCKITGSFKAFLADGADDDALPDFVPMSGSGKIWPNVQTVRNNTDGAKSIYFNSPIPVTVDDEGDLSQGGRKYVMVLASSEGFTPTNFNYSISLDLLVSGEQVTRTYGPFAFNVTAGGTVDLSDAIPVSSSSGSEMLRGPQGATGPQGPAGPKGDKGDAGATGLQGVEGVTGLQGPKGVDGVQGPKGDTGIAGPVGPSGVAIVNHGTDAAAARPTNTVVFWYGSVQPANWTATDIWVAV